MLLSLSNLITLQMQKSIEQPLALKFGKIRTARWIYLSQAWGRVEPLDKDAVCCRVAPMFKRILRIALVVLLVGNAAFLVMQIGERRGWFAFGPAAYFLFVARARRLQGATPDSPNSPKASP